MDDILNNSASSDQPNQPTGAQDHEEQVAMQPDGVDQQSTDAASNPVGEVEVSEVLPELAVEAPVETTEAAANEEPIKPIIPDEENQPTDEALPSSEAADVDQSKPSQPASDLPEAGGAPGLTISRFGDSPSSSSAEQQSPASVDQQNHQGPSPADSLDEKASPIGSDEANANPETPPAPQAGDSSGSMKKLIWLVVVVVIVLGLAGVAWSMGGWSLLQEALNANSGTTAQDEVKQRGFDMSESVSSLKEAIKDEVAADESSAKKDGGSARAEDQSRVNPLVDTSSMGQMAMDSAVAKQLQTSNPEDGPHYTEYKSLVNQALSGGASVFCESHESVANTIVKVYVNDGRHFRFELYLPQDRDLKKYEWLYGVLAGQKRYMWVGGVGSMGTIDAGQTSLKVDDVMEVIYANNPSKVACQQQPLSSDLFEAPKDVKFDQI